MRHRCKVQGERPVDEVETKRDQRGCAKDGKKVCGGKGVLSGTNCGHWSCWAFGGPCHPVSKCHKSTLHYHRSVLVVFSHRGGQISLSFKSDRPSSRRNKFIETKTSYAVDEILRSKGRLAGKTERMAQIRGTAGYNLGMNNQFSGPRSDSATNDPSPLDQLRQQTSKIEDFLTGIGEPLKP